MGAIDVNVKPKKAQLYLDGEYIGTANNYDGWPRYLWLREGTYRLIVYREGYRTLAKRVHVRAGEVIDLGDRMEPGEATRPEELLERVEPRRRSTTRESRSESDGSEQRSPERARSPAPDRGSSPSSPGREGWRDGDRRSVPVERDQRRRPARLALVVQPDDAVVYLDGRLLGSGRELARLHAPLLIDAGEHLLEVIRPGYVTFEREFSAEEGEEISVEARLDVE